MTSDLPVDPEVNAEDGMVVDSDGLLLSMVLAGMENPNMDPRDKLSMNQLLVRCGEAAIAIARMTPVVHATAQAEYHRAVASIKRSQKEVQWKTPPTIQ